MVRPLMDIGCPCDLTPEYTWSALAVKSLKTRPAVQHPEYSARCLGACLLAGLPRHNTLYRYGLKATHPRGMDKMDDILALLRPEEVADALRFVEVWEKAGYMSPEKAAEWRRRIEASQRFLTVSGRPSKRISAPLLARQRLRSYRLLPLFG